MEFSCEQSTDPASIGEPLNRFLIVEFTDDNIAYKSNCVAQKPEAQDFYLLEQYLQTDKTLFEDPDFPASNHTVLGHESQTNFQWVRPSEITPKPKFYAQTPPEFSVEKRAVLHGFLSTAMTCLTTNHEAFLRTVPSDNTIEGELYRGIFHFRFWQYGRWVDVVIDDQLPTMDGELLFVRPTQQNEFWCALLEKAYAKLCGSYSAIASRDLCEAMQDFTGGITERYFLRQSVADECYELIGSKLAKGSLIAAVKINFNLELQPSYSILKTVTIENKMVGLQTPVEGLIEINYLQSEGTSLSTDCYRNVWLRINEFVKNFDFVDICNMTPNQMGQPLSVDYNWQLLCLNGSWISGYTAGGSKDDLKSFWTNPQYVVHLTHPDEVDNSGSCHLVISLLQKPGTDDYHPISFVVFQLTDVDFRAKTVQISFSEKKMPKIIAHPMFSSRREVTGQVRISPSALLIVPCTQKRNIEGKFFLRIFSKPRKVIETSLYNTSLTMGTSWASIARMFYSLANAKETIDHTALASILYTHFFPNKPKFKPKGSFLKALAIHCHPDSDSHWKFIKHVAQFLSSNGQTTANATPERLAYNDLKRIIRDVQQWKEMFDFYDPDRKGYLDRKKLIKTLQKSTVANKDGHPHSSSSCLLQWLKIKQEDMILFEEFIYFSHQNPAMTDHLNSHIFQKVAIVK